MLPFGNTFESRTTPPPDCGDFATYDRHVSQGRYPDGHRAKFSATAPAKFLTDETDGLGLPDSRDVPSHVS